MHPHSTTPRQQFVRLCDCGCGQPTLLVLKTSALLGHVDGQPLRFIKGHNGRGVKMPPRPPKDPRSRLQFVRLCECGCGQPTLLADKTSTFHGDVRGTPRRFLHSHHMKGARNNHWQGGRYQTGRGYWFVKMPDHPHADVRGYVEEHRLVVEGQVGRYLTPSEIVHHRDENPANNDPANLAIMSRAAHMRLHKPRGW